MSTGPERRGLGCLMGRWSRVRRRRRGRDREDMLKQRWKLAGGWVKMWGFETTDKDCTIGKL